MPATIDVYLSLTDATARVTATASLSVPPTSQFTSSMVPARYTWFTVDPYFTFRGMPYSDTDKGEVVTVETVVNGWSSPAPPERADFTMNASSRWIPVDTSYQDSATWAPISGTDRHSFYSDAGQSPVLNNSFTYLRGELFTSTSAMFFSNGSSFYTNDLVLSQSTEVAFAIAFVPRQTAGEMVLFQTGPSVAEAAAGAYDSSGEYFSCTYNRQGTITLYADGDPIRTIQSVSGGFRPSKPLIVGFHHDFATNTLTFALVDTRVQVFTHNYRHPYTAQIWLGTSYNGAYLDASLDLLDAVFWGTAVGSAGFFDGVQQLNQLYGVSAGRITTQTAGDLQ